MPLTPASGRKLVGTAATAGDSSNKDLEFVGAENKDSINRLLLGMGKRNYGKLRIAAVICSKFSKSSIVNLVDVFSLIEQLIFLSPSTDYVSGTGLRW